MKLVTWSVIRSVFLLAGASAFGGGISLRFLNPGNTFTAAVARGDGQTGLYLGSGFMF
jgi:hypothetical protein